METFQTNINHISVKSPLSWDDYFMLQAILASFKSKDPSTKVGAVFVDLDNHQLSMGYNGFIAGIDESQLPWGKDPSANAECQKYGYVVHAEANAILHAPASLKASRCYVTLFPCNECAKLMISKGMKEVIYLSDKDSEKEYNRMSKRLFKLAKVSCRKLNLSKNLIHQLHDYIYTVNTTAIKESSDSTR